MPASHVLIATPAYGGNIKIQYMESVIRTLQFLQKNGVQYDFMGAANAEIVSARNMLASVMYGQSRYSHLLFVDGDMAFAPETVGRLFAADKPLIGAIYPKKRFDPAAFAQSARKSADGTPVAAGFDFVVRHLPGTTRLEVTKGLCRVLGIGMGLCLIQRRVLEELLATNTIFRHTGHSLGPDGLQGPLLGFFDPVQDADSGHLSEDFSFCDRWVRLCGGEVWGLASDVVQHIGDFIYSAAYLDYLNAKRG